MPVEITGWIDRGHARTDDACSAAQGMDGSERQNNRPCSSASSLPSLQQARAVVEAAASSSSRSERAADQSGSCQPAPQQYTESSSSSLDICTMSCWSLEVGTRVSARLHPSMDQLLHARRMRQLS